MFEPDSALKPLASQDGEPIFDEAWQAEVLAMAFTLVENKTFSNLQWSDALGAELANAKGKPDNKETYYNAALTALEKLLALTKVSKSEQHARKEEWTAAYLHTPHGQPVKLENKG